MNAFFRFLCLTIFLVNAHGAVAQNLNSVSDSIVVVKNITTFYMQNGQRLKPKQMLEIMRSDKPAYKLMKKARTNYDVSNAIGAVGGFMAGIPIGASLSGGEPNWNLAYIGGGLILVSIPFTISFNRNAQEAVKLYNSSLSASSSVHRPKFVLSTGVNGIGLSFNF